MMDLIGKWAFVAGVLIAVLFGLFSDIGATMAAILVVIGLVIGLLNITSKEATPFLLAGIAVIIATSFGANVMTAIPAAARVLNAIMILVVPAVILVALREVFEMAKNK